LVSQSAGAPVGVRVLFGLALAALAVALGSAVLVVVPRLHRPGGVLMPGEFLYFGAVRLRSLEQLRRHLRPMNVGEEVAEPWEAISYRAKVWPRSRGRSTGCCGCRCWPQRSAAGWSLPRSRCLSWLRGVCDEPAAECT
jgi:hypothetical protein